MQRDYLGAKKISTVYFGGGTPSLLTIEEMLGLFEELSTHFSIHPDAEITLEANPDDLTPGKLNELVHSPINRLSVGIQSFRDEDLKLLNRVHSANEALASVRNAQIAGFENITIDLIYGIQGLTNDAWRKNIEMALKLHVPHISCYSLTVEPKTPLHSFIKSGKIAAANPQQSAEQFEILMEEMSRNHFIHYEISNFCKEDFYSKHNSNYWKGEEYLGLGPSSHSYNGGSRQWNVKSNTAYVRSVEKGIVPFEKEILTEAQRYNEYVLISLRTIWGLDTRHVQRSFPKKYSQHLQDEKRSHLDNGLLAEKGSVMILTQKGKLFADKIASDLFIPS